MKNLEILLEKSSVEEEIELIQATKEKIRALQEESETFEIFSDMYHKR